MSPKTVLVTGDVVCDHNYYLGNRSTADSQESRGFQFVRSGGGALLLRQLIAETFIQYAEQQDHDQEGWITEFDLDEDYEKLPSESHAFCLWEPCFNPCDPPKQVWRAVEPALGYGHKEVKHDSRKLPISKLKTNQELRPTVDLLVIDDAGITFRKPASKPSWPFQYFLDATPPRWIILKLSGAIEEREFWAELNSCCNSNLANPSQLVIIVSAELLRHSNVRISRGLSWEATVEDLATELESNPYLQPLKNARHLIVTFGMDGAFWYNNDPEKKVSNLLVFDAANAEGEWSLQQGKGASFGYLSCFTAAVVHYFCRHSEKQTIDLEEALIAGLEASRELRRIGHGEVTEESNEEPGFPLTQIAKKINLPIKQFVSAVVPHHLSERGKWMMLDEWQVHARTQSIYRPHYEAAFGVAILGPGALDRLPVAKFGKLQTVDRQEIESLRILKQLMATYAMPGLQKKPLSIGVFGPPGAGKSFGVIQLAHSILNLDDDDILTFNLSQFNDTDDLNGAFHRVRDAVLKGKTPLVFWDEFDSQNYFWLQYLLAPMQDGSFQDGQINHPIGKCIFVFAGATSPDFATFGPRDLTKISSKERKSMNDDMWNASEQKWSEFVLKKGPDFKSRLAGYLNVLGPNKRQICMVEGGQRKWVDDKEDLCFPIRRALFIRAQFKLGNQEELRIDEGVLEALLKVPEYRAGARSLEFLCSQLKANANDMVPRRSHLPGRQSLDMHVDAQAFWEICEQYQFFSPAIEPLAKGLHEDWLKNLSVDQKKNKSNAVPWNELSDDYRNANLAQAARIPRNLAIVGLRVVKMEAGDEIDSKEEQKVREIINKHLLVLSEAEHNGWMVDRRLAEWKYAKVRDDEHKLHHLLIPYSQLPATEQRKDDYVVAGNYQPDGEVRTKDYLDRLRDVGYRVEIMKEDQ